MKRKQKTTRKRAWPFSKDYSEVMKMSWREKRELPNGSGDGRRKKSKTEEDGSYHTAEVSPGDRGRKKS